MALGDAGDAGDSRDDERGEPDQPPPLASQRPSARARGAALWGRHRGTGAGAPELSAEGEDADAQKRRGRFRAFFGVVAERVIDIAPRIPVRDLATLRSQFPSLSTEETADKLVAGAMRGSATIGAGVGFAAMLPVPPAMPAELAAEIVGVASVELKLIAELHELYGHRPPGDATQRAAAYLRSWTSERGIDVMHPTTLNAALGGQMKRELRQRLLKRTFRNLPNVAPFMIGASVGAVLNRRDTQHIAKKIRADLRAQGKSQGQGTLPPAPGDGRWEGPYKSLPPGEG